MQFHGNPISVRRGSDVSSGGSRARATARRASSSSTVTSRRSGSSVSRVPDSKLRKNDERRLGVLRARLGRAEARRHRSRADDAGAARAAADDSRRNRLGSPRGARRSSVIPTPLEPCPGTVPEGPFGDSELPPRSGPCLGDSPRSRSVTKSSRKRAGVIFEVFRQERKGQPFQHAGSVEAPNKSSATGTHGSSSVAAASRSRSGSSRARPSTRSTSSSTSSSATTTGSTAIRSRRS